jgi:hypothetical protein
MGHGHHKIEIKQEQFTVPTKARNFAIGLTILGLILAGIGIATMDRGTHVSHDATTKHEHAETAAKGGAIAANEHAVEAHAEKHEASESHGTWKMKNLDLAQRFTNKRSLGQPESGLTFLL